MAEYEISIVKREPNPAYEPCRPPADYYERQRQEQPQYLEQRQLAVTLTAAEFDVVKQALIAHWAK